MNAVAKAAYPNLCDEDLASVTSFDPNFEKIGKGIPHQFWIEHKFELSFVTQGGLGVACIMLLGLLMTFFEDFPFPSLIPAAPVIAVILVAISVLVHILQRHYSAKINEIDDECKTARTAIVRKYLEMRDFHCQFRVLKPAPASFSGMTWFVISMGSMFLLVFSWLGLGFPDLFYEAIGGSENSVRILTLVTIGFHLLAIWCWIRRKMAYKKYGKIIRSMQSIIIEILRQSANGGSVDVKSLCATHLLSLKTFQEYFVHNVDCPGIEDYGEWDFSAGVFYSSNPSQQLSPEDQDAFTSALETSNTFNVTRFAQNRQVEIDSMKLLLFRFCGIHNIHGRVETAPNGDYLVIPSVAITGEFVKQVDQFIQQVLVAEATGIGKKNSEVSLQAPSIPLPLKSPK